MQLLLAAQRSARRGLGAPRPRRTRLLATARRRRPRAVRRREQLDFLEVGQRRVVLLPQLGLQLLRRARVLVVGVEEGAAAPLPHKGGDDQDPVAKVEDDTQSRALVLVTEHGVQKRKEVVLAVVLAAATARVPQRLEIPNGRGAFIQLLWTWSTQDARLGEGSLPVGDLHRTKPES